MSRLRSGNPLRCERLEDRLTPALFGNPWPDAEHLTLSFTPDGTDVAGEQSNLNQLLGGQMTSGTWKNEIVRAFQTWSQHANLNFNVVTDNGSALGAAAPIQGSPFFGDIRIAARALSDNVLAVSTPFDMFNSWAGEIVLNSNKLFNQGGGNGNYDLYTVVLQEAGHALGVDNNSNTASVMYTTYDAPRTALHAVDVASIKALYGARAADRFDATGSNDTLALADTLTFVKDGADIGATDGTAGDKPLVAAGDLTTLADVDTYAFKNPKGSSDFYISAITEGLGQLQAKISVYGPSGERVSFKDERTGQIVTSALISGNRDNLMSLKVENAQRDKTYRVVVEGATEDVFGIGAYRLAVGKEPKEALQPTLPSGYLNQDYGTDDARDKAFNFGDARPAADARWDFTGTASIYNGTATDVDFYKIHTKADTQPVAVILVSALDTGKLKPKVEVFDKDGVLLATEVLSSSGGNLVVQLTGIEKDRDYYVKVSSAAPTDANAKHGNYTLAVDFRDQAVKLTTFASGKLQGATNDVATSLAITRSQSVWFEVNGQAGVNAAVRMTVYDQNNVAIFTVKAKGGETNGGNVLLAPGQYTVRFTAAGANGALLPSFDFRGRYTLGSDPIGIQPLTPPPGAAPVPTMYVAPPIPMASPVTFVGTSDMYVAPVGGATTTAVISRSIAPPPPKFYTVSYMDLYTNPWW